MKFITDRIQLVLFGIAVSILGVISPSKTVEILHNVLDRRKVRVHNTHIDSKEQTK